MKFKSFLPLVGLAALALAACGTPSASTDPAVSDEPTTQTNRALQIVTTFAPLYAHTLNIADDNDVVTNLVPAGTSVHTRQPTPQDVATLENADVIVINGLGLEEFLEDYLHDLEDRGVMIVDTSVGIATRAFAAEEHEHVEKNHDDDHENGDHHEDEHTDEHHEDGEHDDHNHTGTDPHIWLSIPNVQIQADTITQALTDAYPSQMMVYMTHNAEYQTKLTMLDQEVRAMIASADVQPFVLFHDAYGYYLHEYDIADKQVDVILDHHNDTPTQAETAELIAHIQDDGVATLFIEPQLSPATVEAIQQEVDVDVREIDPIGEQLDADGYITNMRAITEAFVQ